jgi:hypothetical protein
MARLTFKEYLNEMTDMPTDNLVTRPLGLVATKKNAAGKIVKDEEAEKAEIRNYPDDVDRLDTGARKIEGTKFSDEIAKPVGSGGFGKQRAAERAKQKITNRHFGPSQFYYVDPELKTPSATFAER